MSVFKVGDKVTGKVINGIGNMMGVTNEHALLEVTTIYEDIGQFDGKLIAHEVSRHKSLIGNQYSGLFISDFVSPSQETVDRIMGVKAPKMKSETIKLGKLKVSFYENGVVESNFNPELEMCRESNDERLASFNAIRQNYKKGMKSIAEFGDNINLKPFDSIFSESARLDALNNLIKFFIEFQFEPNFRFVNTLGWKLQEDKMECAYEYIRNYFALANNPYATAIEDKIKSPEFKQILNTLTFVSPKQVINKRLKIYFGSQGTGKTTMAANETEGRCIVCNNSILPQDLLEDFSFDDGKPGFHKSMLCRCMEEGKKITLDEINLLPFETIRFLQGILDDKKEFIWKGETIHINDGFGIIGTMNLIVNGMAFGLPEPLIDRCGDIKRYKLTGKELMSALG